MRVGLLGCGGFASVELWEHRLCSRDGFEGGLVATME